jgi:hypothetical protein
MVMVLPFLIGALAVCYGILGRRSACFMLWVVTLAISAAWAYTRLPGPPPLVL